MNKFCRSWYGVAAAVTVAMACQCASVSQSHPPQEDTTLAPAEFAAYDGPKTRLQVIRFGVGDEVRTQYPELAHKRVGWGLCNRVVDILYETNRFTFVEEKQKMLDRMLETWKLSLSGAVAESTAVRPNTLNAPEYLVYAEVFDFSVGNRETVTGLSVQQDDITRIGIQLRLVDVETGRYIPASGTGEVTVTKNARVWAPTAEQFDQSTVGRASNEALYRAVHTLVSRMQ
jgi:curli biogenesis system outer membrane secretion channel CsgG